MASLCDPAEELSLSSIRNDLNELSKCLLDLSNNLAKRTHVAFLLRTIGTNDSASIICQALQNKHDCPLMRHELAYILGQMGFESVCPTLSSILSDESDDVLVRHESAEALGAIGDTSSLEVLLKYRDHPSPEIAETCVIAVDLMQWRQQQQEESSKASIKSGEYLSVDPAPPLTAMTALSVADLSKDLMDSSLSLFHRYRVMFSLRNVNSDESALALVKGFSDSSALFRHEIAYVLGQMQRGVTVDGLTKVLMDNNEHRMVRHEAAEALGAIGGNEVQELLKKYESDEEVVVGQSCQVALDTIDYWNNNNF